MAARKRKTGETFKRYRENLKAESRPRGVRVLWPAERGTYVRAKHGKL